MTPPNVSSWHLCTMYNKFIPSIYQFSYREKKYICDRDGQPFTTCKPDSPLTSGCGQPRFAEQCSDTNHTLFTTLRVNELRLKAGVFESIFILCSSHLKCLSLFISLLTLSLPQILPTAQIESNCGLGPTYKPQVAHPCSTSASWTTTMNCHRWYVNDPLPKFPQIHYNTIV